MGAQFFDEGPSEFVEEEDSDTAVESKRPPSTTRSQSTSNSCSSGVRTRSVARAEREESLASQPSMSERPKKCKPLHLYFCFFRLEWNLTHLSIAVRAVKATKRRNDAPITAEGSMDTDLGSSGLVAEPADEHTLIAFLLFLSPFKIVPNLCGYLQE